MSILEKQKQMSSKPKILIVDDDEDILDLLRYNLTREGYLVKTVADSRTAISVAARFLPDLIVLDLMMPELNGIEICRKLRVDQNMRDVYIFFLTAKSDEYYKHAVFDVGGDDFIEKIIGLKPLIGKIRAVLKRNYVIRKRLTRLKEGSLELVRGIGAVLIHGSAVTVNKHEFEILFFLAQNKGKEIPVCEIVHSLWGSSTFMDETSVRRYVSSLQEKLGGGVIREIHSGYYQFPR